MSHLLAGITWEPNIRGGLVFLTAVAILCGSVYLVLATNTGARLGLLLALTGLFGWMSIMGTVWWVYGIGLKGRAPEWRAEEVVVGSLTNARSGVVADFPDGWQKRTLEDKVTTEALAAADPVLVPPTGEPGRKYFDAGQYLTVGAYDIGGESYGPFHLLNFRPFDLWHEPHHFVVQLQATVTAEAEPGEPAPAARVDEESPVVSVLMVRDLGALRREPAAVAICSIALFGVCVWTLHRRDLEAMRARAEASS
jgi:hypothetical protein